MSANIFQDCSTPPATSPSRSTRSSSATAARPTALLRSRLKQGRSSSPLIKVAENKSPLEWRRRSHQPYWFFTPTRDANARRWKQSNGISRTIQNRLAAVLAIDLTDEAGFCGLWNGPTAVGLAAESPTAIRDSSSERTRLTLSADSRASGSWKTSNSRDGSSRSRTPSISTSLSPVRHEDSIGSAFSEQSSETDACAAGIDALVHRRSKTCIVVITRPRTRRRDQPRADEGRLRRIESAFQSATSRVEHRRCQAEGF
jgi:hypothetical protein